MSEEDIPALMRLKEEVGWNQVAEDWKAYLHLEPQGCFVAEVDGQAVASTTTINYQGRFGWIGMVIVHSAQRRRGIATRMVRHAITYLESVACPCQKLDATNAGVPVYESLGFSVECQVERWLRPGAVEESRGAVTEAVPFSAAHLDAVDGLDREAFGASRRPLLRWYCSNRSPRFLVSGSSRARGFVAGRQGSSARQLGPLVAESPEIAEILMRRFLASVGGEPVMADVAAHNQAAVRLLNQLGFTRQRVLQRMFRGPNLWPGQLQKIFCVAGFEYG